MRRKRLTGTPRHRPDVPTAPAVLVGCVTWALLLALAAGAVAVLWHAAGRLAGWLW